MSQREFDIINRYFRDSGLGFAADGVDLGIGDDCALLRVGADNQLAVSMDLLQEGVHFPAAADPQLLGQRALAVNLSDLAAVGAEPLCFTLGLSLPEPDQAWLAGFSKGLALMAKKFRCPLVGGDLIQGVRQVAIQVHGLLPVGQALRRSGAKPGHLVYVTGTLGDAAAALALLEGRDSADTGNAAYWPFQKARLSGKQRDHFLQAFYAPTPRVQVGMALRGLVSAAIDISDGLLSDLGHIVELGQAGAEIDVVQLPFSRFMQDTVKDDERLSLALGGGDDYELCLTVAPEHCGAVEKAVAALGVRLTRIGEIVTGEGVQCLDSHGEPVIITHTGYSHFGEE
jgi:thiamine-monophosphate kinase